MYSFFLVGFGFGGYLGALPELDVRSAVDPDFRGSANVVLKNQAKKKSFDQHSSRHDGTMSMRCVNVLQFN